MKNKEHQDVNSGDTWYLYAKRASCSNTSTIPYPTIQLGNLGAPNDHVHLNVSKNVSGTASNAFFSYALEACLVNLELA